MHSSILEGVVSLKLGEGGEVVRGGWKRLEAVKDGGRRGWGKGGGKGVGEENLKCAAVIEPLLSVVVFSNCMQFETSLTNILKLLNIFTCT